MDHYHCLPNETLQIDQVVTLAQQCFGPSLVAVYLYGSATLKALRPKSDIDLLLLTNTDMGHDTRVGFTKALMTISGIVGCLEKRPLEVTVINQAALLDFSKPLKCDYMYGEWLRNDMVSGLIPQPFVDPDLTILLWQIRRHSVTLLGENARRLIPKIDFQSVKNAIFASLPNLIASIDGDERNVILTLARMWYTLETQSITTKDVAAAWATPKIPMSLAPLLHMAKEAYLGNVEDDWSNHKADVTALITILKTQIERLSGSSSGTSMPSINRH